MRILVTGAEGFLGSHLVPYLNAAGHDVIRSTRTLDPTMKGVDTVVHLAAIAHRHAMLHEIDLNNHLLAVQRAHNARHDGVKHFVFVSSIAAQIGACCTEILTEESPARPMTPYGQAKLAAEKGIADTGVPYTILRPVVTGGPGAKGNFATLNRVAALPVPLPFRGLSALRSILMVQNFNSAVATVIEPDAPRNSTYVVADPEPLTIGALVSKLRSELGRQPNLFFVPERLLELGCRATGRGVLWDRIGRPLVVNPAKLLALGWRPT